MCPAYLASDSGEEQLRGLLEQQRTINEFTLALGQISDLHKLYETIHGTVRGLMDADAFIVSFFDPEKQEIRAGFVIADGVVHDAAALPPIPIEAEGSGIQSEVIRSGEPLVLPDFAKALARTQTVHSFSEDGGELESGTRAEIEQRISTRSSALVPMKIRGETTGVIQVQSKRRDAFSPANVQLLASLANVAAIALANARLFHDVVTARDQLERTLFASVQAMAQLAEMRDPYTAGHQRRVAELASAIGRAMELDTHAVHGLRMASILHDIGKLAIPAEILSHPGSLTRVELDLVRQHPQLAHDVLETIESPWPIAEIVLQHHERLDGSGYPQALCGDAILPGARILAVADVVEAMSSHRPYRPARGLDAALAEVERGKGGEFDPAAVDACVALFRSGRFAWTPADSPRPSGGERVSVTG